MGRLDNKVAVITDAASGSVGTAIRFAVEGASVVIADLNEEGVPFRYANVGSLAAPQSFRKLMWPRRATNARTIEEFGMI